MSVFTNPIGAAADQARAYIEAVLGLVAGRDPLGILEELPAALRAAVEGLSDAQMRRPEAPGKWSILGVLQHLADSELVWAWRLRLVVAEERPTLTGYDQDRWAERLAYRDADPTEALRLIEVLRAANLRLLRSLSPADLARVGIHAERGEESVEHMIALYAGHDLVHRRQIARIRDGLQSGGSER